MSSFQNYGTMPGVGAIHTSEIKPTIEKLENALHMPLYHNLIGSANKYEYSSDIDVAVDIPHDLVDNFVSKLDTTSVILDYQKASPIRSTTDIVGFNPKNSDGRRRTGVVQVDFFIGNVNWLKVYYFSPTPEQSKYKGVFRNILLSATCAYLDKTSSSEKTQYGQPITEERYVWSPTRGLVRVRREKKYNKKSHTYYRSHTDTVIAGPWLTEKDIAKELKFHKTDCLLSFEQLEECIRDTYDEKTIELIFREFVNNDIIKRMGVPEHLEGFKSEF